MKRTFVKVLSFMLALAMLSGSFVTFAFAEDAAACPGKEERHTLANTSDYTEVKVYAPVCDKDGYTSYKCNTCGIIFVDNYVKAEVATAHAWNEVAAVAPTCLLDGTKAYQQCANCKDYVIEGVRYTEAEGAAALVVEALGHDYVCTVDPGNCVAEGVKKYECSRCDAEYTEDVEGSGEGHKWVLVSIDEDPSVDGDNNLVPGSATYECSVCHTTAEFPVHCDHEFVDATCVTPETCRVCGFTVGAALGHTEVVDAAVAPTCTATGLTEGSHCDVCGETLVAREEVPAALCVGATLVEFGAVAGDCVTTTVIAGEKCSVCEHVWKEPEDTGLVKHDLDTVVTPATCTLASITAISCKLCDYEEYQFGEGKLGHTVNYTYEQALEKGLVTAYTPASCEEDGSYTYKCERCDVTLTYVIAATEHEIVEVSVVATCVQYAYTYSYCSNANCEYASVDKVTVDGVDYDLKVNGENVNYVGDIVVDVDGGKDADNHTDLVVDEYINVPTCTVQGNGILYCGDCGYRSGVEVLPAKGHSWDTTHGDLYEDRKTATWDEDPVVTPATCTTDGYTTYGCTDCDATIKNLLDGDHKDALGHLPTVELPYVAPTCTATGLTQGWRCERCGVDTTPQTVISKLGHDEIYSETVAPKCDGTRGYDIYVCNREDCSVPGWYTYKNYVPYEWDPSESYESVDAANKIHTLDLSTEVVKYEGDCVNGAIYTYTCSDCGKDVLITLPAEHTWGAWDAPVAPTCTATGTATGRTCTACGAKEGYAEIPATGHTYALNSDAESHWLECACGDKIDAEAHTWTPNNDEDNHWVECACGEIKDVTAHTYTSESILDPTCTATGTDRYTCECGYYYDETVAALGHSYVATGKVGVLGCETDQFVEYQCTTCKEIYLDEYLSAHGHKGTVLDRVEPDCDDIGYELGYYCEYCHFYSLTNENGSYTHEERAGVLEATGVHKNADGVVIVDSCLDTVEDRHCVECGEDVAQTHGEDIEVTFAPTCINVGYTTRVCLVCDKEIAEPTNVKAPIGYEGHQWTVWTKVEGVICTVDGAETRTCEICGEIETRAVEHVTVKNIYGHSDDEHWLVCDVCGAEVADTRDAHDWTLANIERYPQPGVPGIYHYECVCGATKVENPAFEGIKVSFDYDSAIYEGAAIVNGGLVVLNVYLEGTEAKVENIQINLTYDAARLTYVSQSFTHFEHAYATFAGGNGTIYLHGEEGNDAPHSAVTINGKVLVGQIVFRVDDYDDVLAPDNDAIDETNTTINFVSVSALTPEDADENGESDYITAAFENSSLDITVEKLGAISANDKCVGINDASAIQDLVYNGEYNARADINKDGYVDAMDFICLAQYLGGVYDYAGFVAIGVR